jgi:hypothetical protein
VTTLFDSARRVKTVRRFANGLSFARRAGHTAADEAWWAANSPANAEGFDLLGPSDETIEQAAGMALAQPSSTPASRSSEPSGALGRCPGAAFRCPPP